MYCQGFIELLLLYTCKYSLLMLQDYDALQIIDTCRDIHVFWLHMQCHSSVHQSHCEAHMVTYSVHVSGNWCVRSSTMNGT